MSKSLKQWNSCLALLLVAVMVILCPLQVAATAETAEETAASETEEIIETEPEILYEIKSERDEYTKHFMLDNGNIMAVQYSSSVHYLDDDGSWSEYDNTMLTSYSSDAVTSEDEKLDYQNKSSDIDIKLSKKSKENNMFKVKGDNYQLSWGYSDTNKSTVEFIDNVTELSGNDEFIYSANTVEKAVYKNIYDNVDLDCYITSSGVKENLILHSSEAQNEFVLNYTTNGLTAAQNGANSILFKSGDEVVYTISAPFVQDVNGAENDKVTLTILEQKNNKLKIQISIDSEWINSGEAAFPVTVDPELTVGGALNTVTSALLSANQADTATKQSTYFYVGGNNGSSNIYKGIVKINQLPELKSSDRIVNADIRLTPMNELSDMTIYAHEVTNDWNVNNATWNSVGYSGDIIDYNTCESGSTDSLSFDITKTAKKWYDGSLNNYGILFESNSANRAEFGGYQCYYHDRIPALCVTYKNFNGTENSLSYHTNNIGANTTIALCDYTGSMLVNQTIVSGTGSRMPVSITATYNGLNSDKVFQNGSPCGYGWQFSFNQYIAQTSQSLQDNGYDYVYTDSDGTEHYFVEKTYDDYEDDEDIPAYTEWEDEDGLGLTLWFNGSYAYMTDGSGVETKYEPLQNGGKILSKKDEYNNEIIYSYTAGNLTSIQDGAGRVYSISYAENTDTQKSRVVKITLPDSTSVCFSYNSADKDKLSAVLYKDGSGNVYDSTSFVYNQSGLLSRIVSFDNSEIRYEYNSSQQVTKITEYGTDLTMGNYLNVSYTNDNTTTFTDKQGRSKTYTFDNAGNCVTVLNADGYIESYQGADTSIGGGSESYTHNYISASSNPNSAYFQQTNGTIGNSASSGGSVTFDNSAQEVDGEAVQYLGDKSIKITNNGQAQFYTYAKQTVGENGLTGEDVTLSAYVKTSGISSMDLTKQSGALLTIKFINSSGNLISQHNSVAIPNDSKWQRISVTQKVPSGTANIEVNMALYNAQGTAWFDCIQLERGSCMNDYNALSNSNFTGNSSWDGAYYINGTAAAERRLSQSVRVNKKNISFTITGKAQATSVPLRDNRKFGIMLSLIYNDKTTEDHYAEFNYATSQEQSVSLNVVPEKSDVVVHTVYFRFIYDYNVGTMTPIDSMLNFEYLDGYSALTEEETEAETEDTTEAATEEETFDTTPYVGSHSTYDQYGNITSSAQGTIIPSEDGNDTLDTSKDHIITHTTYDSTGNYAVSETDQRGSVYSYDVNTLNGRTNSVTDPKNNSTSYTYDAAGNVTSVSSGGVSNSYTYSANKLTAISHNGTSYNFAYNSFGNTVSTKIGSSPLITHTYESNNGKLINSAYGNGDEVNYTYDSLDRITAISNDSEVLVSYTYNKKSQVTKIVDYGAGLTTDYEYSQSGGCIGKSKYSTDLSSTYYEYETMDDSGNVVKTTVVDGVTKTVTESTDETGNNLLNNDGWVLSSQADDFGRQLSNSTLISEDKKFTTEYTYVDGANANETTELIKSITQKYGDTVLVKYSYTYDQNGNILTVSENDVEKYAYTYDSLNQLYSVTDKVQNYYYVYSYTGAGNIQGEHRQRWNPTYGYTEGSPISNTYDYNDSSWKDKLTQYNSSYITYDEIGNPINYRDGMTFSWENGRQLASMTKGNKTTSYTYDISGMRTQKNVDGTVTKYYYDDSNNLVSMVVGDKKLMFYYDQNGSISSVLYGGTRYYYVKNLQGDITMLVDENGSIAARYTYDHQGALASVKDNSGTVITSADHIANLNPLRYRGYVYDTDSGLYYLQSRYYDPDTGRFINADVYCDTATGSPLSTNMFAYCENNPVNASDYNGYYLITFTYKMLSNLILSMLHINLAVHVLSYWSWNYNYENNRLYYTGTYITNQKTSIISTRIRMGFFTGDYNGCGWIATYNALRFLGCKNIQPYNIVSFYDSWGILLYGAFGILPDAVADYFRHLGYSNVDIKLCIGNSGIDRFIANHRVAIVFYIHSSGGHYVMVYREKKQFYSYNMFSNFSGRYSHGSSFEKTLNERGRVAVAVIGIK